MFDFKGRTLVLTGATGGIGFETAKLFHKLGANLVLADIDIDNLKDKKSKLDDGSAGVEICAIDVSKNEENKKLVSHAVAAFGSIDFLVPCAGIYPANPIKEMTVEQWHKVIDVNLNGVFYLIKQAIDHLNEHSSIVTLSSVAAFRGAQYNAHYAATKGAIVSLTRSLAKELGPKTRVNALAPGIIETLMTKDLLKTRYDESVALSPLKRLGQPSEMATVIAFLCSSGASFITGEIIQANGGIYMS
ncbi:SDR family NAD(P)-dependent oxidoreductase [uncultured Bartonella sp.]|uniref:SDR family NAD(P)-dependent oxidoreductase n=1 Tax=uncultured Bartonella sp. TaxID=104108 RepID=UPI00261040E0|nr:SDR family NAD(P)-dependent oxidoreductase [uncultured Bartonella sp.]